MTGELLAIIPGHAAERVSGEVRVVRLGDHAAVLVTERPKPFLGRVLRRHKIAGVARRMQQLESLMALGPVLPALPGTRLSPDEAYDFLSVNAQLIDTGLDRVSGSSQFQVKVDWREDRVLQHFRGAPELAPLFASKDVSSAQLHTAVGQLASRLRGRVSETLSRIALELAELPRDGTLIANFVLLAQDTDYHALDAALGEVDAIWPDGLRIQQIGPAPALSFYAVRVERFEQAQIGEALRLLNLTTAASADEVRCARQNALRAGKPADEIRKAAQLVAAHANVPSGAGRLHLAELYADAQPCQATEAAVA